MHGNITNDNTKIFYVEFHFCESANNSFYICSDTNVMCTYLVSLIGSLSSLFNTWKIILNAGYGSSVISLSENKYYIKKVSFKSLKMWYISVKSVDNLIKY